MKPPTAADTVRRLRIAQGLRQTTLAARTGLTQAAISGIERGLRVPTVRTLIRLSQALKTSPPALLEPAAPQSLSRDTCDRIARWIVQDAPALNASEQRLGRAIGSLIIQKLRAHQAPGAHRYARSRWHASHRTRWIRQTCGEPLTRQVLQRVDALLAMGAH